MPWPRTASGPHCPNATGHEPYRPTDGTGEQAHGQFGDNIRQPFPRPSPTGRTTA
ncbi:hypothetical protein DVS28_a2117 [Euzebya pacifica]|uniref:Uncharacterized protein n=1 Tax=Euzebya pacifica TaxID=1608957 RepID=A0A346XX53_9ACTN|nr:hypothetical protein DVS28_a2117 [Euzebya pacifica]